MSKLVKRPVKLASFTKIGIVVFGSTNCRMNMLFGIFWTFRFSEYCRPVTLLMSRDEIYAHNCMFSLIIHSCGVFIFIIVLLTKKQMLILQLYLLLGVHGLLPFSFFVGRRWKLTRSATLYNVTFVVWCMEMKTHTFMTNTMSNIHQVSPVVFEPTSPTGMHHHWTIFREYHHKEPEEY